MEEAFDWIPAFGIQYKLGVDGLSLALVVLTTTLTWISILASFGPIQVRIKEYMISFLILEVGMIGVFLALDTFLFYIFWEVVLVPMYLIIGIWGGANRIYATIKFVLYTLVGSLLMLVAILATAFAYQGAHGGAWAGAFDFEALRAYAGTTGFADGLQLLALRRVLPRLRDQGPDVPVPHLAARRPRRGADGGLGDPRRRAAQARRLRLHPVQPVALPGRVAYLRAADHRAQPDRDHLRRDRGDGPARPEEAGRVLVGQPHGLRDPRASSCSRSRRMDGAILQMVNHGLITGALFLLVGVIYERTHDRTIAKMGGLAALTPVYAAIFGFFVFASAGLPALSGFVGEFLTLVGTFVVESVGRRRRDVRDDPRGGLPAVDVPAGRARRAVARSCSASAHHLTDMTPTEILTLAPLGALVVVFGLFPGILLDLFKAPVAGALAAAGTRARRSPVDPLWRRARARARRRGRRGATARAAAGPDRR